MHHDQLQGINRCQRSADKHQPGVAEHEHDKVDGALLTIDENPAKLAGIDLALHTRHIVDDRLIVTWLSMCMDLFKLTDIAAQAALRSRYLANLTTQFAGYLDGAHRRITFDQFND